METKISGNVELNLKRQHRKHVCSQRERNRGQDVDFEDYFRLFQDKVSHQQSNEQEQQVETVFVNP